MEKTDQKWMKMGTRKKNKKEKETIEEEKNKERIKAEKKKKREELEKKREEKNEVNKHKNRLTFLRESLKEKHLEEIESKINPTFVFCQETHQFVSNISCIFRIFSDYSMRSPQCDKCSKYNKYMSILEEIIENGRKRTTSNKAKGITRNKTSRRSENKKT